MRILITGANGFLGSSLSSALEEHEVIKFLRHKKNADEFSFTLPDKIPVIEDVNVCFHFAALTDSNECMNNPEKALAVNEEGTRKVAEMLAKHSTSPFLIYSSTLGIFNTNDPIGENTEPKPNNTYAISKVKGEKVVEEYSQYFPTATLRLVFPYGKQSGSDRLISRLIRNVSEGYPVILKKEEKPLSNPVYISDVIMACKKLIVSKKRNYRAYNIGGSDVLSIANIAEIIGEIMGKQVIFEKSDKNSPNYIADYSLAAREIGYRPLVSFKEGLIKTISG